MDFKPEYTKEDADELLAWIDTKPSGRVDLGGGLLFTDVALFVQQSRYTVEHRYNQPTYAGLMDILFRLREKMQAEKGENA